MAVTPQCHPAVLRLLALMGLALGSDIAQVRAEMPLLLLTGLLTGVLHMGRTWGAHGAHGAHMGHIEALHMG